MDLRDDARSSSELIMTGEDYLNDILGTTGRQSSSKVWLFERAHVWRWYLTNRAPTRHTRRTLQTNSIRLYSEFYVEILFNEPNEGLLRRTVSGFAGVALTLGNEHETKLALEYVETVKTNRPSVTVMLVCARSQAGSDATQQIITSLRNMGLAVTRSDVNIDIPPLVNADELAAMSPHPDSVLAACSIADAIVSSNVPEPRKKISKPIELLDFPPDDPVLRVVQLMVKYPRDAAPGSSAFDGSSETTTAIFDLTKTDMRSRCKRQLQKFPDAEVQCFVQPSLSLNMSTDAYNLGVLVSIVTEEFEDDEYISTDGLTFRRLVTENACRWHWLNTDAMAEELSNRSSVTNAQNYVYLIGLTGEGKSSTYNKILNIKKGCTDGFGNVAARVGSRRSTTQTTQEGRMLENSQSWSDRKAWIVVDTPGMSDDNGRDGSFLAAMADYVSDRATANLILLVKQRAARLDASEREAIREYSRLFGPNFKQMLRIVCTNTAVLMDGGVDATEDQVDVEGVVRHAQELFDIYEGGVDCREKVYFIGEVPTYRLGGGLEHRPLKEGVPEPLDEIERLRKDIKQSQPMLTVSANTLRELLQNADSFWSNAENMKVVTEEARSRLRLFDALLSREDRSFESDILVFTREQMGLLGWFNMLASQVISTHVVGQYDQTVRQVVFRGETPMLKDVLSKAKGPHDLFNNTEEYIVTFVGERVELENRVRILTREFELIERNQQLSNVQRRRVASMILGKDAYREEVRAAIKLCGQYHDGMPCSYV